MGERLPPRARGDEREAEDPLAADRRTLTIGAIAMVALILVGVVSAQLFARPGCGELPASVPADGEATADAAAAVAALAATDGDLVAGLESSVGAPVTAAAPAADATGLTVGGEGLVATGPTTTTLNAALEPVSSLAAGGVVVGDGEVLHHLVLPNELTGQVDAVTPLAGPDLAAGDCLDTALVGAQFAFLLDADADQVLLFRAEEEGEAPVVQLRDADTGGGEAVWDLPLTLPPGAVGVLAERLSGALGDDTVVVGRRLAAGDEGPAVVVADRADGSVRAEVGLDQLLDATGVAGDGPVRVTVLGVGDETALLSVASDPAEAPEDGTAPAELVRIDLDGSEVTALGPSDGVVGATAVDGDRFATLVEDSGVTELVVVDADGTVARTGGLRGIPVAAEWVDDDVVVATDRTVARVDGDTTSTVEIPSAADLQVLDALVTADARMAVLVRSDGQSLVLRTDPLT